MLTRVAGGISLAGALAAEPLQLLAGFEREEREESRTPRVNGAKAPAKEIPPARRFYTPFAAIGENRLVCPFPRFSKLISVNRQ